MDYKANAHYFSKSKLMLFIGVPLVILFILEYEFWIIDSFYAMNAFTVLGVVGFLMIIFFFVSTTKDAELDKSAKKRIKDIVQTASDKAMATDKFTKIMDTYIAESYIYEGDMVKNIKRGKDGTFRTNVYSASAFVIGAKKLFVYTLRFSLTEEKVNEDFRVYAYPVINEVCMKDSMFQTIIKDKKHQIETHTFNIKSGKDLLACPSHNDSLADEAIKKIYSRREKETVVQE
jgi:hypothetical protein